MRMDSAKVSNDFYRALSAKGLENLVVKGRTQSLLQAIKPMLRKSDAILDLACGYGRITLPLAELQYKIEGIDLAPNLIRAAKEKARKKNLHIQFRVGDMRSLPYKDNSFDKIICLWSSFNHLLNTKDHIQAINEVHRILKPGGMAFFEMTNMEQKKQKEWLTKNGVGLGKRLAGETFLGVKNIAYNHDRKTLRNVCEKSRVRKFMVGFKNIGGRRRIVMYLYK